MEILRIPTHFRSQMEYLSHEDRWYILLQLMRLSEWEIIEIEQSMRWWIAISVWKEACQLEKKARKGKGEEYNEVNPIISYGWPLRVTPEGDPWGWPLRSTPTQPKSIQINSIQIKTDQTETGSLEISFLQNKNSLKEKLLEFIAFRKSIKKPIREESVPAFIKKLEKLSESNEQMAIEILDESIANGWQGIFPLEKKNTKTRNGIGVLVL